MTELRIVSEPRGDAGDATFVRESLNLFNVAVAEPFRRQGYGAKLLRAAEDEARTQGCYNAFLTTFSFQAKPFYEKFGYEVVADIPDYPNGHSYHVLKKKLL